LVVLGGDDEKQQPQVQQQQELQALLSWLQLPFLSLVSS